MFSWRLSCCCVTSSALRIASQNSQKSVLVCVLQDVTGCSRICWYFLHIMTVLQPTTSFPGGVLEFSPGKKNTNTCICFGYKKRKRHTCVSTSQMLIVTYFQDSTYCMWWSLLSMFVSCHLIHTSCPIGTLHEKETRHLTPSRLNKQCIHLHCEKSFFMASACSLMRYMMWVYGDFCVQDI